MGDLTLDANTLYVDISHFVQPYFTIAMVGI